MHAHGQVIGEERQLGVLANCAEVTLGLLGATQGVEGSRGDEAVDADSLGTLGLVDDAQGLHVDDAGQDGHAAAHDGDGLLKDVLTLGVGQEGNLAGGAQEEETVDAGINHAVDVAAERLEVKRALGGQRNDYGRNDAFDALGIHLSTLSFLATGRLFAQIWVEQRRCCAQEKLSVLIARIVENLLRGAFLHRPTTVHDDDAVGDVAHRLDVVADEDHG